MKKIFLASFAAVALLFASCSSDKEEVIETPPTGTGSLEIAFDFDMNQPKAASTAVRKTGWEDIKQVQVLITNNTGVVVFSDVIKPVAPGTHPWASVPATPAGDSYTVTLIANVKSNSDAITTMNGAAALLWDASSTTRKALKDDNADLWADFKASTFPAAYDLKKDFLDKAYAQPSEIFVAQATGVIIAEGVKNTTLTGTAALQLKREVSMLRVRIDNTKDFLNEPAPKTVLFNHASCSFMIHNMPLGYTFKGTAGSVGGILKVGAVYNNKDRILVTGNGAATFSSTAPTATTHNLGAVPVLDTKYKIWNEFIVLPNLTPAESAGYTNGELPVAQNGRKYFIVFSAHAPAGYVAEDGTAPAGVGCPIYWSGTILEGFTSNTIREASITINTRGKINPPTDPVAVGGLTIEVSKPADWSNIIRESGVIV